MKKLLLVLMIAAVFVSCKKNDETKVQPQAEQASAEVSFNITQIIPEVSREFPFDLPECSDTDPMTADIVIMDGEGDDATEVFNGTVSLFTLPDDPNLYTQAIKLMLDCDPESDEPCCNTFYVTEFYVKDAAGDIIYAAPSAGSDAQGFLDYPERMLNRAIEICEFTKYQYDIDVLCYEEAYYMEFGFVWFNVHEVVLCEVCFFVDVCLTSFPIPTVWEPYYDGDFDMVGVFGITANKLADDGQTWVPVEGLQDENGLPVHTNYDWENMELIDGPLCVPFANYLEKDDIYHITWHVYLPDGNGGFCWRAFAGSLDITLNLLDQCDYSAYPGAADNNVIELIVTDGYANSCAEPGSMEWFTNYITDCHVDPVREIGSISFED